jgi:hypothetical protein
MAKLFVVSTSDRIVFKRCRRKWDFQSKNRQSLAPIERAPNGNLWLGSGFHFGLEDYHGYRLFRSPQEAFREGFVKSHRRSELPENYEELTDLAVGMYDYYIDHWLPQHGEPFKTLWIDGVPQVEVNVQIPLDIEPPPGYDEVVYSTTFDRVGIDEYGRIIIEDYKTAGKLYEAGRLELDPQVSAYDWAGHLLYGDQVEGGCWTQFLKSLPHEPEVLKDGELSRNKNQYTTAAIYKAACLKYYGEVPKKYYDFINYLASQETPEGDRFIKREVVYRNRTFARNEERKIFAEINDMLNPGLEVYPNPTRDCTWDCEFRAMCTAMNDGSDWEFMRDSEYERWEGDGYKSNTWRSRLQYPEPIEKVVA